MVDFIKAGPADVPDLILTQNKAFLADYQKYGECPGYNREYESMLASVTEKYVYKIVKDGSVIGDFIVTDRGNGNYFLGSLCVIPGYQNTGIGTSAMNYIQSVFCDAKHWSLETPVDNARNIHFYMKLGFSVTNRYLDRGVEIALLKKKCL